MHILIIPAWYPTDSSDIAGSFFREQAQALRKYGCKVGVITLQLRSRGWHSVLTGRYDFAFEDDRGVLTYRKYGVRWCARILPWLWQRSSVMLFKQYIKKHGKPDIIHVHSMLYAGVAAKAISDKYQIPYIVTEHCSAFARGLVTPAQKEIVKQVAVSAKKRFAVSKIFAELLFDFIEMRDSSWEVIPNIVHERFFRSVVGSTPINAPFVFINVALLTPNKGGAFLIRAFAKALALQPSLKLKIGGDGCEKVNLHSLSYDLGVDDNIEFLGMLSREQVVEQMKSSDALVHSSQYETFGVVVIEALALGKPVIATRCGGPEDIVRKHDGLLVPVNDEEAMAAAMLSLYNNRKAYESMEIRTACYERYSEQAVTKKLMQVYHDVLGKKMLLKVDTV